MPVMKGRYRTFEESYEISNAVIPAQAGIQCYHVLSGFTVSVLRFPEIQVFLRFYVNSQV